MRTIHLSRAHARRLLMGLALALGASGAGAQSTTELALASATGVTQMPYAAPSLLRVTLRFPVASCPSTIDPPFTLGVVRVEVDGRFASAGLPGVQSGTCGGGLREIPMLFDLTKDLPIGEYTLRATFVGTGALAASMSPPLAVRILPTAVVTAPAGGGALEIGSRGLACATGPTFTARNENALGPATPGPDIRMPFGALDYAFGDCTAPPLPPPGTTAPYPGVLSYRMELRYPETIPPGTSLWRFAAPTAAESPRWTRVPAIVDGRRIEFQLDGHLDQDGSFTQSASGTLALVLQHPVYAFGGGHGMWWSGPEENGWGLGVAQEGDKAFFALYVYGSDGRPDWFVLSGGAWDPANSSYVGFVHRPTSSFFGAYFAGDFRVNAPVGLATLQFADGRLQSVTYRLDGADGFKSLRPFQAAASAAGPRTGLWWGGELQNGWGLYFHEEADTLFAAWYTYDLQGEPTWFVMSEGRPTANGYSGVVYRARGAQWLGVSYDPTRLSVTPVGTMSIAFTGPDAGTFSFDVEGNVKTQPIERFRLR